MLEQLLRDVVYAGRMLRRNPVFSLAAVLTLALGIGSTTAIFSIVYGVLVRSLPFSEPAQLVALHTAHANAAAAGRLSPPNFVSLHEYGLHSFNGIESYVEGQQTLVGAGEPRKVESAKVSAGLFDVLGVKAAIGRTFDRRENSPGNDRVVILGNGLWQQAFGGSQQVIGRTVQLDGMSYAVIGVMPPGFDFPRKRALWVPQSFDGVWSAASVDGRKRNTTVSVIGRLRPGVAIESAQAELAGASRTLEQKFPNSNAGVSFTPAPLLDELVGDVDRPLLLLLGAVSLVLSSACANVAGLLLARGERRRSEIAVRIALGASRRRIVGQLVTESLVLGIAGGVLGVAFAIVATGQLVAAEPAGIPRLDAIRVDGPVLAFAVIVALLTGLVTGVLPALRAAEDGLAGSVRAAGRGTVDSERGQRVRGVLVAGQVALAVMLLVGAGLLLKSFVRLTSVDPGFHTDSVLAFRLELPAAAYSGPLRARELYDRLVERVGHYPGVRSAALVFRLPVAQSTFGSRFRIERQALPEQEDSSIGIQVVSGGYLRTMGIGVVRGRGLDETDGPNSPPVVMINEAAAKRFFPDRDPVGRRLVSFSYDPVERVAEGFTIVGVVADVRTSGLSQALEPEAFFAHAQVSLPRMHVVIRTNADPLAFADEIRRDIMALDPHLPMPEFETMEQVVAESVSRPRFLTTLVGTMSAMSLLLAMVGIFGLVSFAVAQRTREIGIRIALGASPLAVVRQIVRHALMLAAIGLIAGLAGALALSRLIESQLFAVSPVDPIALAGVSLLLVVTVSLASLIPAWRAASIDPLVALRAD